jgi:hypothetical protein
LAHTGVPAAEGIGGLGRHADQHEPTRPTLPRPARSGLLTNEGPDAAFVGEELYATDTNSESYICERRGGLILFLWLGAFFLFPGWQAGLAAGRIF